MVRDLKQWLAGPWVLKKKIHDSLAEKSGSFEGIALFKKTADNKLHLFERGTLYFGDYQGFAYQQYLYEFPKLWLAHIFTQEGQFFHVLDLTQEVGGVEHVCKQDRYKGRYRVIGTNEWELIWEVNGPHKNLLMHYFYDRKI